VRKVSSSNEIGWLTVVKIKRSGRDGKARRVCLRPKDGIDGGKGGRALNCNEPPDDNILEEEPDTTSGEPTDTPNEYADLNPLNRLF
jgi:hypothetical protein